MGFCSSCGTAALVESAFCVKCGTAISNQEIRQQTNITDSDQLANVSQKWRDKFSLIEKAGGTGLPKVRELSFSERLKTVFNVWGSLFGPFYYLAKGMWKRAIVLTALCIAAFVLIEVILETINFDNQIITSFIAPAVFAVRANIDFYKKTVLGDNGWW